MFPDYRQKLNTIIWMGIGSVLLSSIFSAILLRFVIKINKKSS